MHAGNDPTTGHAEINMAANINKTTRDDPAVHAIPGTGNVAEGDTQWHHRVINRRYLLSRIILIMDRKQRKWLTTSRSVPSENCFVRSQASQNERGRPRRRGLSVDPKPITGSDEMMSVLLGIRQDNATLKSDIVKTLDSKMSEFKSELDEKVAGQSVKLEGKHEMLKKDRVEKWEN